MNVLMHERANVHHFFKKNQDKKCMSSCMTKSTKMTLEFREDSDQPGHIPVSIENV